jgi:hypothetical protein
MDTILQITYYAQFLSFFFLLLPLLMAVVGIVTFCFSKKYGLTILWYCFGVMFFYSLASGDFMGMLTNGFFTWLMFYFLSTEIESVPPR